MSSQIVQRRSAVAAVEVTRSSSRSCEMNPRVEGVLELGVKKMRNFKVHHTGLSLSDLIFQIMWFVCVPTCSENVKQIRSERGRRRGAEIGRERGRGRSQRFFSSIPIFQFAFLHSSQCPGLFSRGGESFTSRPKPSKTF